MLPGLLTVSGTALAIGTFLLCASGICSALCTVVYCTTSWKVWPSIWSIVIDIFFSGSLVAIAVDLNDGDETAVSIAMPTLVVAMVTYFIDVPRVQNAVRLAGAVTLAAWWLPSVDAPDWTRGLLSAVSGIYGLTFLSSLAQK